jgi:hypothetical protein
MENLRKCPTHKYGATYNKVKDSVFQCVKCGGSHRVKIDEDRFTFNKKIYETEDNYYAVYGTNKT